MSNTTDEARAPISIHFDKNIDRLIVLNSLSHPDDKETKTMLAKDGYLVQAMGNIYTIAGPHLDRLKLGLESVYGISLKPID